MLPIACDLSAADLQKRRGGIMGVLGSRLLERRALPDGLALRLAPDDGVLEEVAHVIALERACCRFLRFRLTVEPDGGPIELELTGPPGTREFLDAMLEP